MVELGFESRDVFDDDHVAFRQTVRRFFRTEVEPHYRDWEREGTFPAGAVPPCGRSRNPAGRHADRIRRWRR